MEIPSSFTRQIYPPVHSNSLSLPQDAPLSPRDDLTFYPLSFPYLPSSDHLLFTSKHEFFLLQMNSDFIAKMSVLSPVH